MPWFYSCAINGRSHVFVLYFMYDDNMILKELGHEVLWQLDHRDVTHPPVKTSIQCTKARAWQVAATLGKQTQIP